MTLLERIQKLCAPLLIPCPTHLFNLDVHLYHSLYLFNKVVNVSKCLSSMRYSSKLSKPKEKVIGTPNLELVGQKHKTITWVCYWYLKGGGAGGGTGSLMGLSPYL